MSKYVDIFHTVPLLSQVMTRDSTGTKVDETGKKILLPQWSDYVIKKNTKDAPLLGAIALEDFIGIDIDNNTLFIDFLEGLGDTQPTYIAKSLPSDANKGGHILFSYRDTDDGIIQTLLGISKYLKRNKIDVQIGNKLIYLPTSGNKTKQLVTEPISSLDDLVPLDTKALGMLMALSSTAITDGLLERTNAPQSEVSTTYGYMLRATLTESVVAVLTPKREYPKIREMDDIPEGHATNWMLQVRKKLQIDPTVGPDDFRKTIMYLASLWTNKRGPSDRLEYDIARDITMPEWQYDEKWYTRGYIYPNRLNHTLEIFYDDARCMFIQQNSTSGEVIMYDTATKVINSITSTHKAKKRPTGEQLLKQCNVVRIVHTPEYSTGLSDGDNDMYPRFNTYKPSVGVQILRGDSTPQDIKHPSTILAFLEHLIPEEGNRMRMMQFLRYKYTTFAHSPLYFVFAGVGGAGKGLFVQNILGYFSEDRIITEDLQGLTNNFNSQFLLGDWLEIEEAGEGYTKRESAQLVASLKKITGNPKLSIEAKGRDKGMPERHFLTPIISTNMTTQLITDSTVNDRRLVLIKSPTKLDELINSKKFRDSELAYITDTKDFYDSIIEELPSFAYYLKGLDNLSHKDYNDNGKWKTDNYYEYIEDTLSFSDRLYDAAARKNLDKFITVLKDANVPDEQINTLFSVSIEGRGSRALLLWNRQTRASDLISLQDIAEDFPVFDSDIRTRYKSIKERRSYKGEGMSTTIQVIEFHDTFHPTEEVQAVQGGDIIDLE